MDSSNLYSELRTIRLELEMIQKEIASKVKRTKKAHSHDIFQNDINRGIIDSIQELLNSLQDESIKPMSLFKKAYGFLNEVDQREFVVNNIMESLKKGKSLGEINSDFKKIGLVSKMAGDLSDYYDKEFLEFCLNLKFKTFKTLKTIGSRIVTKSIKAIPEFISIKPQISFLPAILTLAV